MKIKRDYPRIQTNAIKVKKRLIALLLNGGKIRGEGLIEKMCKSLEKMMDSENLRYKIAGAKLILNLLSYVLPKASSGRTPFLIQNTVNNNTQNTFVSKALGKALTENQVKEILDEHRKEHHKEH